MANGIQDIFGYIRNPNPESVFSTEESILTFGDTKMSSIGYMVQNWNVNYQQQVQELFEIGSSALYWMKGRPQGQGSIARVIGEQAADTNSGGLFPSEAYDICNGGASLNIEAKSGACGNAGGQAGPGLGMSGVTISLAGCVVTQIGFSVQVQDTLINENVGFRFGAMQLDSHDVT